MRFWDSSAIVPIVIDEPSSDLVRGWYSADAGIAAWWSTVVECHGAIFRARRLDLADEVAESDALVRLAEVAADWHEVGPSMAIRADALRMLASHDLRAADALQLAAALSVANDEPRSLEFVCLDRRLAVAARSEGFTVVGS